MGLALAVASPAAPAPRAIPLQASPPPAAPSTPFDRAVVEHIVHAYLLEHPDLILEAMARLEDREQERRIAGLLTQLEKPFDGAWLGNPNGDVVIVEFLDYGCGHCRRSVSDVERLVAGDPNVKVVFRPFPILGPLSLDAARLSLAAARAGKFPQVHTELFGGPGLDAKRISTAGRNAHVKMPKDLATLDHEIRNNKALAQQIGITGTPAFVVGGKFISGAVGYDELKKQIDEARLRHSSG